MDRNNELDTAIGEQLPAGEAAADTASAVATEENPSGAGAAPAAEQASAPVMDISPSPKKGGFGKKAVAAILACGVVAGGLFAASTFLKPEPEDVIKSAYTATYKQQEELEERIYTAIPAAKPLFVPDTSSSTEDTFSLTLNSVEGVEYAEMINAMLSGLSISGQAATSVEDKATELTLDLSLKDIPLIDAELFFSPKAIAASVPSLSEKTFSINLDTIVEDYKNSIFYGSSPISDEELEMLQSSLQGTFESQAVYSAEFAEKLNEDILGIMAGPLANAEYGYSTESKMYTVTIPGADVKQLIVDLCRYIYIDSEMAAAMEKSMNSTLAVSGGVDYKTMMQELISEIETSLPGLPTVIELDIKNDMIKTAHIVCTPDASADAAGEAAIGSIIMDMTFEENSSKATLSISVADGEEEMTCYCTAISTLENDVYKMSFILDMIGDTEWLSVPFEMSISANGDFNSYMSIDITEDSGDIKLYLDMSGAVTAQEGMLTYDLPECSVGGSVGNTYVDVGFSLAGESAPLAQVPSLPADHIPLFGLGESELAALYEEYSAAGQSLIGRLAGLFMGG